MTKLWWRRNSAIERLEGISSRFVSDHILNLLEEVEGKLPEDKAKMLAVIDQYLALSEEERRKISVLEGEPGSIGS